MIVYEKTFISNVFVTRLWFLLQGYIMDSQFYLETLKIYICRPTKYICRPTESLRTACRPINLSRLAKILPSSTLE